MSNLWYGHFDSTPEDPRKLKAFQWAKYISSFITDGIKNGGTCLQVSEDIGMKVKIDEGVANIQGYIMRIDADLDGKYYNVLVPDAHTQYPRIDRLILRLDLDTNLRTIKPTILKGTAMATPIAPTLTRNTSVWELSLAQIRVNENTLTIAKGNITDERFNTDLCGLINSILGLDPSAWQSQFDTFLAALETESGEQLQAFYEHIQHQKAANQVTWDAWFATINADLRRYAQFNFGNLAALPGVTILPIVKNGNLMTETMMITGTSTKVAEIVTDNTEKGFIKETETVFRNDGITIFSQATMRTNLTDGSVVVI